MVLTVCAGYALISSIRIYCWHNMDYLAEYRLMLIFPTVKLKTIYVFFSLIFIFQSTLYIYIYIYVLVKFQWIYIEHGKVVLCSLSNMTTRLIVAYQYHNSVCMFHCSTLLICITYNTTDVRRYGLGKSNKT